MINMEVDANEHYGLVRYMLWLGYVIQLHGAKQLEEWCLHFISTNYLAFEKRPDFERLTGANKEYVEMNRWPPVSYLNEVKEFEQRMSENSKSCSIM